MMKTIIHIFLSLVLIGFASCQEIRTVTVAVTEEDGSPLEGVNITVTFLGYKGDQTQRVKGNTDEKGVFSAQGKPMLRMSVRIEKEGYYRTDSGRLGRNQDHNLVYILRKIKTPIPLYAKRLQTLAPVVDEEFGYDCELGDWVVPHGKGLISDLIFKASSIRNIDRYKNYHHELSVRFSRKHDGFVKFNQNKISDLKSPYQAPNKGIYNTSWIYFDKRSPNKKIETNAEPARGYFFRFRTQVDANENIVSCHYAKAYGDVPDLKIYFNPTSNDRNLEFDPKRNLFKNLDSTELVREP